MSDNRDVAKGIILTAGDTIVNKRPGVHGSAENSFAMIGELWTIYLRHAQAVRGNDVILPQDVSQMMSILKKCRAVYGDPFNEDNFVDDVGYTALAGMLQLPDPKHKVGLNEKELDPTPKGVYWDGAGFVDDKGNPKDAAFHQVWLPHYEKFPRMAMDRM